jgi:hypothetical protein
MRFASGMGIPIAREANIMRYAPMASSLWRSGISSGWGRLMLGEAGSGLMVFAPG